MKNKVIEVLLGLIITFLIIFLLISCYTLNKYTTMSKTIDKRIEERQDNIKEKETKLQTIIKENEKDSKQVEATEKNIQTLKEEIKKYEK